MKIYISMRGEQSGPYALSQIESMWNNGIITEDALYCKEGQEEWRNVSELILSLPPKLDADSSLASLQAMTGRVNRLEWQNRLFLCGLIITLVLAIFMRHDDGKSAPVSVPAQDFALRDAAGTIRWKVGLDEKGAVSQSFFDAAGKERVYVGVDEDSTARFRLFDGQGTRRVSAYAFDRSKGSDSDFAGFSVLGPGILQRGDDTGGFDFFSYKDHTFSLRVSDSNGKERYSFNIFTNGLANQLISDSKGNLRILDYAAGSKDSFQCFYDDAGNLRNSCGNYADGSCVWSLFDNAGHLRMDAYTLANGTVAQRFATSEGAVKSSTFVDNRGEVNQLVGRTTGQQVWDGINNAMQAADMLKMLFGGSRRDE